MSISGKSARSFWVFLVRKWWCLAATLHVPLRLMEKKNTILAIGLEWVHWLGPSKEHSVGTLCEQGHSLVNWNELSLYTALTRAKWALVPAGRLMTYPCSVPGTEGGWGEIWITLLLARGIHPALSDCWEKEITQNLLDIARGSRKGWFNCC